MYPGRRLTTRCTGLVVSHGLSRRNGITTTSEPAYGAIDLKLEDLVFDRYFKAPGTPMRCVVVTDATTMTATKGKEALAFVQSLGKRSTDKLVFHGAKFFADDSFVSLGMVVENPGYTDGRKDLFILERRC